MLRDTPKVAAISAIVWSGCCIRCRACVTCFDERAGGRPPFRPRARAAASPAIVRSREKNLPAGVVVGGSGVDAIGQASNASDVDVAFDIAPSAIGRFSLVDQSRIRRQLAAALNAPVDFVERPYLRPRIADRAAADMLPVF